MLGRRQRGADQSGEPFAALDVIAKLVEARAGGESEHDIAFVGDRDRARVDGSVERSGGLDLCRRAGDSFAIRSASRPIRARRDTRDQRRA